MIQRTERGDRIARHIGDTMMQAHRGAYVSGDELLAFGNDGYAKDERARREVEAALAWAQEKGLTATDFGTDEEGYSWALVFQGGNPDELADLAVAAEEVLWRAWMGDKQPG